MFFVGCGFWGGGGGGGCICIYACIHACHVYIHGYMDTCTFKGIHIYRQTPTATQLGEATYRAAGRGRRRARWPPPWRAARTAPRTVPRPCVCQLMGNGVKDPHVYCRSRGECPICKCMNIKFFMYTRRYISHVELLFTCPGVRPPPQSPPHSRASPRGAKSAPSVHGRGMEMWL